jgi:2-phospho-L-lactate guanylyltransferase
MNEMIAVLIPIKSFNEAKERLSEALDKSERSILMQKMAETVINSSGSLSIWVVCDDDEVASWAESKNVSVIKVEKPGLNNAVEKGVDTLEETGFSKVIIAHADLPNADDLQKCANFEGVTIVQDHRGDGTPVLVIPTGKGFRFSYGPNSFASHTLEAQRLGLPYRQLFDPKLSFDVDEPEDLKFIDD